MGCCAIITSLICIAALTAGGILAWRYGPWNDGGTSTSNGSDGPTLTALRTCDGCCNGLASNCARPINEVLFPMVHNAHSSYEDYFAGYNNQKSLEKALVEGYRGLMLDSCICDGSLGETIQNWVKGEDLGDNYLGFCHTSCDAGVRDPSEVLRNIKTFLDINRNEILILEFEINDNSLVDLYRALDQSGLDEYVYRSSSTTEWPTMQALIDVDARLLLFAHGDGMESCSIMDCPEGIFYTFDHFQQTDYNDGDTSCDVTGTKRDGMGFFLMNNWKNNDVDLPSRSNAEEFNKYNALVERFQRCEDRIPNILAVDFWDVGDVLEFAYDVNRNQVTTSQAMTQAEGV
ncbi:hypothetical protein ACHAXR_007357 [Thalassiosira sp. AJA248-18]